MFFRSLGYLYYLSEHLLCSLIKKRTPPFEWVGARDTVSTMKSAMASASKFYSVFCKSSELQRGRPVLNLVLQQQQKQNVHVFNSSQYRIKTFRSSTCSPFENLKSENSYISYFAHVMYTLQARPCWSVHHVVVLFSTIRHVCGKGYMPLTPARNIEHFIFLLRSVDEMYVTIPLLYEI